MDFSNYLCIGVSLYIFFLGMYIFRFPDRKKIQRYFLTLSGFFSIWISAFVIRQFISYEYRHYAFDWMLIPTIFFPILFDRIVSLISNPDHKSPKWQLVTISIFVMYFLWAAISCSFSILDDKDGFKYTSTIHYHILIGYQIGFVGYNILKLIRSIFLFSGEQRVRLTLMVIGVFVILIFALIFIYILPLLGIFYGFLSSIGALIFFTLWAVAILQYNAFEIKAAVLSGQKVSFFNRVVLIPFLILFRYLDPNEFRDKSIAFKIALTTDMLYTDMNLLFNTDFELDRRAEVLARKYYRYIK
ncbi:putative membrane protein [Leptospira weilii str. 2006001853]|nr:hypothetical protein [Leptospira weilii]EKR64704.1 putative membrane protein [Leptospira weilii str. 2006001853]